MKPGDISGNTVLISALDWGMGHTTRCIPIIRQLLEQKNHVIFAGNDLQCQLIEKDFSAVETEKILGYNITLDPRKSTYLQLLGQIVPFQKAIRKEKIVARQLAEKYKADVIISDNRYGFLSAQTKNIFITHQLSPPVPKFRRLLSKILCRYVNRFDICWIPDDPNHPLVEQLNLVALGIPKYTIGWLSRFRDKSLPIEREYLIIVSGPEPARSQFVLNINKRLEKEQSKLFVLPEEMRVSVANKTINPSTSELEQLINTSKKIISRAGYTTIMELASLKKEAILIPTPGQYEQNYLAQTVTSPFICFLTENEYFK